MAVRTTYLHHAIDIKTLPKTISKTVKFLQKREVEFDAIAFRGSSGMLVAPSVALALDKPMILVRKEPDTDNSHSWLEVEGESEFSTYIIVDDQVSSGLTVYEIVSKVERFNGNSKCIGIVLYNSLKFLTPRAFTRLTGFNI